jgi:hypothetical protein
MLSSPPVTSVLSTGDPLEAVNRLRRCLVANLVDDPSPYPSLLDHHLPWLTRLISNITTGEVFSRNEHLKGVSISIRERFKVLRPGVLEHLKKLLKKDYLVYGEGMKVYRLQSEGLVVQGRGRVQQVTPSFLADPTFYWIDAYFKTEVNSIQPSPNSTYLNLESIRLQLVGRCMQASLPSCEKLLELGLEPDFEGLPLETKFEVDKLYEDIRKLLKNKKSL